MATLNMRDGVYYANLVGLDGKRKKRSLKTGDRREAEALLANIVRQQAHARILGPDAVKGDSPVTYADFIRDTFKPHIEATLKASTATTYGGYIERTLAVFGDKYLAEITPADLGKYLDSLRGGAYAVGKKGKTKPYTPATVNRIKNFLSGVFSVAVDRDILTRHPMKGRKLFKNRRENNLKTRWLSPFEERRLLQFSPDWLALIIRFGLATGCRMGEIRNLRWADVDRENRVAWLRDTKSGEDQSVPLNKSAEDVLGELTPFIKDGKQQPWVFLDPSTGAQWRKDDIGHAFRAAVDQAGLEGVTFHTLRHTCATRVYRATRDLKAVQTILRHSALSVTARYAHDDEAAAREAINTLDANRKNEQESRVSREKNGLPTPSASAKSG